jgi:hypothetical protein
MLNEILGLLSVIGIAGIFACLVALCVFFFVII